MRLTPFVLSACAGLVVLIVACADSDDSSGPITVADSGASSSGNSSSGGSSSSSGNTCEAKTCETVDGACGSHDDGCGKTFSCGVCKDAADACAPMTCTMLKKDCGSFDDACGGIVNCGECVTTCPKDGKEPNNNFEAATSLGKMSDYDNGTVTVTGQQSSDGDEDWFKVETTDGGFGGNPLVTATVTDTTLEVSIFHSCTSKPDFSFCPEENKGKAEDIAIGKGCYDLNTVQLKLECKGINESGNTFIRVRKRGVDGTCHAYDLTVKVE